MKKKIIGTLFFILLIAATVLPASAMINELISDVVPASFNSLDGGWIEERDGVKILHVNGTYYEMGYQHGYILRDEIPINLRIMKDFFNNSKFSYDDVVKKWNVMKNYVPEQYLSEMQGVVDGSGLSLEEIGVLNIVHDVVNLIYCCGGIAWGSATVDGELVHLRSGDMSIFFKDAKTGTYLQDHQVLIVRDPEFGYASMSPVMAGDIGSYGGFNEKGICVSENTCVTDDTTLHGISASFRMRMVLDNADNGEEALYIMDSNRTCGWNLFISDGNIPKGYVLEQTANVSYISTWNDSIESIYPFWMIENVSRRSNCFISPDCAVMERKHYNPSGFRSLLRLILGLDNYFVPWTHYKALSKGFENNWGNLDLNTTMDMFRNVYLGKTNLLFYIMMKLYFYQPVHQWVACPKNGDMVISFASADKMAQYNPVHYFNLFELLEAKPPP